jgi:hypothetical protein
MTFNRSIYLSIPCRFLIVILFCVVWLNLSNSEEAGADVRRAAALGYADGIASAILGLVPMCEEGGGFDDRRTELLEEYLVFLVEAGKAFNRIAVLDPEAASAAQRDAEKVD